MLEKNDLKTFDFGIISKMRDKQSRVLYIHFLDHFIPNVIGCTPWKRNRSLNNLGDYFTISDEAFLLLCYECYHDKWIYDYKVKKELVQPDLDPKTGKIIRVVSFMFESRTPQLSQPTCN